MKLPLVITLSPILITSCNSLADKIEGGWVIDQAYYHNRPVVWNLYNNALELNADGNCYLPPINRRSERSKEEEIGT